MTGISESIIEETCLDWLNELGSSRIHGPDITSDSADKHTAKVCFQVLKAALASVAGERR